MVAYATSPARPPSRVRSYSNLPLVRSFVTGRPVTNHVRLVNRSEEIRRIFEAFGNMTTREMDVRLGREGLEASDSLIRSQRKRLLAEGLI